MGVIALKEHVEQEADGETSLELIGLRYSGGRSTLTVGNALQQQGQWPGTNALNRGVTYFALVPDEGLGYLESRDDLDVLYGAEEIAAAMLEQNNLPSNVFGRGADRDLQGRVWDHLGIEDPVEAGPVGEQLRRIAGIDEEEAQATSDDGDRKPRYVEKYERDELGDAAKILREDADEFDLRDNQSKSARAEFIASFDEDEAASALQEATGGDEEDDD